MQGHFFPISFHFLRSNRIAFQCLCDYVPFNMGIMRITHISGERDALTRLKTAALKEGDTKDGRKGEKHPELQDRHVALQF